MSPIREIQPVDGPPSKGKTGGLGELVENTLLRFLARTFNQVRDAISDLLRHAVERTFESLETEAKGIIAPFVDRILAMPDLPPDIRRIAESARVGGQPITLASMITFLGVALVFVCRSAVAPVSRVIEYFADRLVKSQRLDFPTLYAAALRDGRFQALLDRDIRDQGWNDEQIAAARLVLKVRLDVAETLAVMHRGEISEGEATTRMARMGVDAADIPLYLRLSEQIPPAADLVRFALREAWRDDVAQKWGYDQGQPAEFAEWMGKLGFGDWAARNYWRAHWAVPSPGQGFPMMWRGEISEGELRELLVINDLAPGWISPLMAIARPLPGRIDRRWAYEEGIIGADELRDLYAADGYDDKWADAMRDMVVSKAANEAKGLTRASILSAYKKRRISPGEALDMLADLGIQPGVAQWYIEQADLDRSEAILDERIDLVGLRFVNGSISAAEARQALQALHVGSDEAENYLELWAIKRETKVKRPSRTVLDKFFRQGVIDIGQFRAQMALLNYDDLYVSWYLDSLSKEAAADAAKEEERAQKERLRIDKERKATEYEKAKAHIDQDVAEVNAAIADAQVALVQLQNERDQRLARVLSPREEKALKAEYTDLFHEVDAEIAQSRLTIERLQTSARERSAKVNDLRRALAAGRDLVQESAFRTERLTLDTDIARYRTEIAHRRTQIATLEELAGTDIPGEEIVSIEGDILTLRREIAEIEESIAEARVRQEEIDESLPVQLDAERRVNIETRVRALQAEADGLRADIEEIEDTIREAQVERVAIDRELDNRLAELPGRAEQIELRAHYGALIDKVESRIAELREDVARLRVKKTELVVAWRS